MESNTNGYVVVERIRGKSTITRCFSKYPLKLINPNKVGSSTNDAVWIYSLTYGGGIVSGDAISCGVKVGDGCTAVFTTQSSTKVYKSVGSKCSEQLLEASIGSKALLVFIPDPVTCFSTAKYSQKQIFRLVPDSSLVLVDWITCGRHASGEKWDFAFYKSTNNIFLEGYQPLFLDTVLLEQGSISTIARRMQDYLVIAMVILIGPQLKQVQNQIQMDVKKMMSDLLYIPSGALGYNSRGSSSQCKPAFIASCSAFGPKGIGVVIRISAMTTESVYQFLRRHLSSLEMQLGAVPYHGRYGSMLHEQSNVKRMSIINDLNRH